MFQVPGAGGFSVCFAGRQMNQRGGADRAPAGRGRAASVVVSAQIDDLRGD